MKNWERSAKVREARRGDPIRARDLRLTWFSNAELLSFPMYYLALTRNFKGEPLAEVMGGGWGEGGGATYEKYSYKGKIFKEIREILTEKVHAVKKSPTPALTFLMILSLRVSVPAPWGISPTFQMSYLISLYYPPTTSALIIFSFKYLVILVVPGSPRINLHLYCNGFCEGLF